MAMLTPEQGFLLLGAFWLFMLLATQIFAKRKEDSREEFLAAKRHIPWWMGGASVAASWTWAGALLVSTQMSYEKGLAGLFWFLVPNIIALGIFFFLGPRIREMFAHGFTLPQYISHRLGSPLVHKLYLIPFFFGQVIAVAFNVFAASTLISVLTGISVAVLMPILVLIPLSYTLLSGVRSSIVTDFMQMVILLAGVIVVIPLAVAAVGGFGPIEAGFGGTSHTSGMFDPEVAFAFGIVTSIGLISQTLSDQQYWQRVFAIKKEDVPKAFLFGAFLFAVVPLGLSLLGFMAANPATGVSLPAGTDPSMIGILTVSSLVPAAITMVFVVMLMAGLCSPADSGISAAASLWVTDVIPYSSEEKRVMALQDGEKKLSEQDEAVMQKLERRAVLQTRVGMVVLSVVALAVAYLSYAIAGFGVKQLFLLSISIAACISVPTVLSLYWEGLKAKGVFIGSGIAIAIGMPAFIYFNWANNAPMIVASSVFMLVASAAGCLLTPSLERLWNGGKGFINKSKW